MTKFYYYLFYLFIPALLINCTPSKKVIYFQGAISSNEANKNYALRFQTDDLLSVNIMGIDAETSKPFNLPTQTGMSSGGYEQGAPTAPGYLVDTDGNIDLPLIGKIKVAGLRRKEVIDSIKIKLKPFLSDATVIVRILNFKVTVLGEVHKPGTFTIPNERITLPEAIGIAGDLSITGKRKNILVIRDQDGKKTEYRVDLTSKKLFESPVYYLNQNDLVYVEPNKAKINSSAYNPNTASVLISATSLILTLFLVFKTH